MATSAASLSAASASVRERFGWRNLHVVRRLSGGYANDVFAAEGDGGHIVIRIVRRPVDLAELAWEHRLLGRLAPSVPEVIAPLKAPDGSTFFEHDDRGAVVVLPFVDGRPAQPWFDRAAAATVLARFHRAAADLDLDPRPGLVRLCELREGIESGRYFTAIGPAARPLPPELAARGDEIDTAREWMLATVEQLAQRGLTTAPTHGDVFRGNMLVRDGSVVGMVDWEEANVDWVAHELANAMWEFCKSGDLVLDRDAGDEFVRTYRNAGGPVPSAEDDTLIPLVRVRRVLELLRAPYDRTVDWNYQLCNLEAFHGLG